jgi:hypothetical protein
MNFNAERDAMLIDTLNDTRSVNIVAVAVVAA